MRPQAVWDALDIERIKTACDPGASADLAAVLITVCRSELCSRMWLGHRNIAEQGSALKFKKGQEMTSGQACCASTFVPPFTADILRGNVRVKRAAPWCYSRVWPAISSLRQYCAGLSLPQFCCCLYISYQCVNQCVPGRRENHAHQVQFILNRHEVDAMALQEGLANVCLVGASTTLIKAKIEASLPRKRGAAAAGYDKAIASFYDKACRAYAEMQTRMWSVPGTCCCVSFAVHAVAAALEAM